MTIRFTDAYSTSWQGVVLHLAAGEELPGGELANYLLATGAPVESLDPPPPAEPDPALDGPDVDSADGEGDTPDADPVPEGTVADVLAWVGDDLDRAARALETEHAGKDRAGITGPLAKLLEA